MPARRLLPLLLLLGALHLPAAPSLAVRTTSTPPKIDGVLSPGEWEDAAHSDTFRQVTPRENADPTERTEFWVTYDTANVYVAIRNHDAAGLAGLRAYSMQHDQDNGSDDLVRIVFDTFHRENDGYYFTLTAAGGRHEGLIQNKTEPNDQWDALWLGKVSRDAGGWSAEFAIPTKTLSFDPAGDTWGFNLERVIRRRQERVRWAGFIRSKLVLSLPDLGELRGLHGLQQGHGLDLKPFASLNRHSDPEPDEHGLELKPGLDLVWHVTPSLAATLTVNTDFADAEVDERQVNLGRFDLFFPEKRAFFTQDASLFDFASIFPGLTTPYFSRRIGLAADGTKVGLLGGLKLTGRAGPWTLGLLDVQTDTHAGIAGQNLLVGRVARQVLAESTVGVIFTNGDPRGAGTNRLLGVDFNYVNSHLPDNKTIAVHTYVMGTDSDFADGRDVSAGLYVDYSNEPFTFIVNSRLIGPRFDPALGFAPRPGVIESFERLDYTWRPSAPPLRRVTLGTIFYWVFDFDGRIESEDHNLPALELEGVSGDLLTLRHLVTHEHLDAPFAIHPGVTIPTGDYRWTHSSISYETTPSRPVSAKLEWAHGGFYSGHRSDYEAELGWRPSHHLELVGGYKLFDVRLPQDHFAVRLASAKAVYTFTPDLQLSLLGQYDNLSHQLGVNFRVKWIMQPGNEVFLVVNQGYDASADRLRPTQNDTSLKGAWTFRF